MPHRFLPQQCNIDFCFYYNAVLFYLQRGKQIHLYFEMGLFLDKMGGIGLFQGFMGKPKGYTGPLIYKTRAFINFCP